MAESWDAVLDRLETDLAAVERSLAERAPTESDVEAAQLRTWVPPRGLGPLPDRLIDRARELAAAQARVAERLDLLHTATAHQLSALRSLPATPPRTPVFVDVRG
ncbi:hypothetical protein [Intrasporangium flavum]|uniref:hypothetical protein n=1 Tax=Intrasporangium flavum TaxID=1428657 RepID=UPI0009FA3CAB|nr:hypothetical protein [Intrasporangium flavum]